MEKQELTELLPPEIRQLPKTLVKGLESDYNVLKGVFPFSPDGKDVTIQSALFPPPQAGETKKRA